MDKEGKNGTFREMGHMFGINFQERWGMLWTSKPPVASPGFACQKEGAFSIMLPRCLAVLLHAACR